MKFSAILGRFEDVSEEPDGGYLARCPAHADSRPSLRIWLGEDGTVRLTCRAGCVSDDVVKAAGLTWQQMFNAQPDVGDPVPRERPELVSGAALDMLQSYLDICAENLSGEAIAYAERRFGVTEEVARELGIGFDDGTAARQSGFPYLSASYRRFPRLVVPLNGFDGVARGAQGRDITGECPARWVSLKNPSPRRRWATYGVFSGGGGFEPIVTSEGPGDGLTAASAGYDVIMIRGASLAASPELAEEIANGAAGRLVVATGDPDDAGRRFNRALSDGLGARGIAVHGLDNSKRSGDLSAWYEDDPSGFAGAFHAAVRQAQPVRHEGGGDVSGPAGNGDADTAPVSVRTADDTEALGDSADRAGEIVAQLEREFDKGDVLNAHALVAFTGPLIKWAPGLGFLVWNGTVWEPGEMRVRQAVHYMGRALKLAGSDSARGFSQRRSIDDLLTELRAVPGVLADVADFDAKPHLLSFANGTVDLRSGELRPHSRDDLLTYSLSVNYSPAAGCPRWLRFLEEIFPNHPELPGYLQRVVGYGITGSTNEQCFAVLWGKGANGKSVFTDTLTNVFRGISRTTGFSTFEEKRDGGIPNDLAALRGARLVMASEGEAGRAMSESVLKRATGKDEMQARFLRKEFFSFKPTFLIMLATNHQPKFKGQDEGLWRRVKMVPFLRYFAPAERDYELDAKLLAEAEGIAAWAVAGAVAWYADGLRDPEVITAATKEYRETSDALAGFFPGVLVRDASAVIDGVTAFQAYLDWCEAENLPAKEQWTRTTFYAAMTERGAGKKRVSKGIALTGVTLAETPPGAAGPGIFGKD